MKTMNLPNVDRTDETPEYIEGYQADSKGLTWWNNPYAEVDWVKAALWWQGYSYSRFEVHHSAMTERADQFNEIVNIVEKWRNRT